MHGAGVVRALRQLDPTVEIVGIGGDMMAAEGMRLLTHCRDLAFMGFVEVVRNLGTVRRVERILRDALDQQRPDAVMLIDYPGLNLRLAAQAKKRNIPVLYYIGPQVWAWHKSRIHTIARLVKHMKVVFPFEVPLYEGAGVDVEFVGHPLVERLATSMTREDFFSRHALRPGIPVIALLPGSRHQEIERMVPVLGQTAALLAASGNFQCVLGVAPNLGRDAVARLWPADVPGTFVEHGAYDLMAYADAAIVTSGTATLETGWFGTPMAVVYATSPVTYAIGRMLVDVEHIGLVNIVAGRTVVPEFIQGEMTPRNLAAAMRDLVETPGRAAAVRTELAVIKQRLGGSGASEKVARSLIAMMEGA
jgi:lipid-A-disaccharide synthase